METTDDMYSAGRFTGSWKLITFAVREKYDSLYSRAYFPADRRCLFGKLYLIRHHFNTSLMLTAYQHGLTPWPGG
jgi:hypothetical protein